jgi:hypothetical protein
MIVLVPVAPYRRKCRSAEDLYRPGNAIVP